MEIPKTIEKNNNIYTLEKCYSNCYLYKNSSTGIRECFQLFDLIKFKNKKKMVSRWEREKK